jgi:hypothetical protein
MSTRFINGQTIDAGDFTAIPDATSPANDDGKAVVLNPSGKIDMRFAQFPEFYALDQCPDYNTGWRPNGWFHRDCGVVRFGQSGTTFYIQYSTDTADRTSQSRNVTSDWATANNGINSVTSPDGVYLFLMIRDTVPTVCRVYRYTLANLSAGGTLCTFSGQTLGTSGTVGNHSFTTDGAGNYYFNYKAGNSANSYVVSKYTLSGTTFTYVSDITCGSTATHMATMVRATATHLYGWIGSTNPIHKYNMSGTLIATIGSFNMNMDGFFNLDGGLSFYIAHADPNSLRFARRLPIN